MCCERRILVFRIGTAKTEKEKETKGVMEIHREETDKENENVTEMDEEELRVNVR